MTFARDLASFADQSANNLTFRNSIINGAMQVSQRATSFTSTGGANNDDVYTLDRWTLLSDGNDAVDVTQATDAPTGFKYSCGLDVETANKKFGIIQFIENQNIAHLTGKTVTLSFYAKTTGSSISDVKAVVLAWTGTADTVTSDVVSSWNASGTVPTFAASWTAENTATNLSVTSSWARYSVSTVLDTSNTNNVAVFIWCDDATTTAGDFLYVSGVQLEVGVSASAFENRDIGVEILQCQRYYQRMGYADQSFTFYDTGSVQTTTQGIFIIPLLTEMRIAPSVAFINVGNMVVNDCSVNLTATSASCVRPTKFNLGEVQVNLTGGTLSVGRACRLLSNNQTDTQIQSNAEL
jgi:hypothetical protein